MLKRSLGICVLACIGLHIGLRASLAQEGGGLAPLDAAAKMTVPDGFKVDLIASEPNVTQPIALAIDDRGRLWIAEGHTYPQRAPGTKPVGEGRDRIIILEDTDGDGSFETQKTFIEGLNLVSGLEVGFDGVWVGAAPYLMFIADKDHDDKPDGAPDILLDGFGWQDTHETLNSFTWGPDGWLYGCHGVFTHSRVGRPGTPDAERTPLNAGVWRYHPVTHKFEVFAWGTSNPWGVDFDDRGQCFITACVIPHLYHMIQGGRYQRQGGRHFDPYVYDDIKTIADHLHYKGDIRDHAWWGKTPNPPKDTMAAGGGHAHAGAMFYLGDSWPKEYRGRLFMNNIHGARINSDIPERTGSGFVGHHGPDLIAANDLWSQIISLRMGPDGSMYFIDWYDRNQCHRGDPASHDQTNGRVFRLSYGKPAPAKVDLAKLSDSELVKLQLNGNDWYVRHARRLLQERAVVGKLTDAPAQLRAMFASQADETRRLRAMWALHTAGGLTDADYELALADASEYVRAWAIQLMLESGEAPLAMMPRLIDLSIHDPSPVVRLYLASAVQRGMAGPTSEMAERTRPQLVGVARNLIAHEEDAEDHNLPLMYWYAIEPIVGMDKAAGIRLAASAKIPLLRQFIARRLAAAPDAPAGGPGGNAKPQAAGRVAGAIEGESMRIVSKTGGDARSQKMDPFPKDNWSGVDHLWWTGANVGDKLTLELPVAKDGKYKVLTVLTKARDYGIVQLSLDGKKLGGPIDLFNFPDVITTGVLDLGEHELTAGMHQLQVEIVGANAKAIKAFMFGLDYVKLEMGK